MSPRNAHPPATTRGGFGWRLFIPLFLVGGALGFFIISGGSLRLWGRGGSAGDDGDPQVVVPTSQAETASSGAQGAAPEIEAADPVRTSEEVDRGRETALVRAARRAGPAVVSINVMQTRYVRYNPFGDWDPFDAFFRGFIPGRIYREEIPGLGSGVILKDGVVLTNEHVVSGAEQIKVTLQDGRTFDGRLVGADPNYDLAVVKFDGENVPTAPIGDSDDLMVGEWVVAIGNPFGFLLNDHQPTVTAGVVSATHRDVKPNENLQGIYKDMIQTDASINPGNSGGPLVNSLGEIVGINTFIFQQGGGSLGISFAIPINEAARVAEEILEYGRVRTPWLGIKVRPISNYLAAYFGIRDPRGLLVWTLDEGSPADEAGIRVGDIIRKVNGEPVQSAEQAQRLSFGAHIGDELRLTLERGGELLEVTIVLREEPESD